MTTTTISDDQKKNAVNVLEPLGSFRGCFQQWSNLVSVRRRSVGWNWDLENNDPPGVPDLGLRERLARLGAELLPDLNSLVGEPAISQGALVEIVSLCESARDNALLISPQPGKYYGPAFDVLEADLRSLSGGAEPDLSRDDRGSFKPTTDDIKILQVLCDAKRVLTQEKIEGRLSGGDYRTPLGAKSIKKSLARLADAGLVRHPPGALQGWTSLDKAPGVLDKAMSEK